MLQRGGTSALPLLTLPHRRAELPSPLLSGANQESNSRSFLGETGLTHLQNEPCWKQALASRGLLLHKLPLCLGTFLLHTDQDLLAQRTCFHVPNCKHQKSCHCSDMTFSYSQAKHFLVTAPTLTLKLYVLYMTVKNNHCIVVVC